MTDGNEIERVVIARQAERSMKSQVIEGAHGHAAEVEAHRLQQEVLRHVTRFQVNAAESPIAIRF